MSTSSCYSSEDDDASLILQEERVKYNDSPFIKSDFIHPGNEDDLSNICVKDLVSLHHLNSYFDFLKNGCRILWIG